MVRQGLTIPFAGVSLPDHEPLLRRADALGYHDLWSGEATGYDGFTPLALAAAWTERARLGTGVVNPYTRGPALLAQSAAALADASAGRFVLGIGSSSDRIVERWNGIPFEKPLTHVREAVAGLRPVFAGERGAGGFKLEAPPPEPIPIYVAALRGRMLRLAGEVGDGAWVNFLPLSAAEQVVGEVRAGEQAAGREPGSVDIVCRFFNVPAPPEEGLPFVRFMFAAYATVPVYAEYFRWLGFADQIDPMVEAWEGGDRKRAVELVPEDLARDVFVFGGPDEQRERLAAFAAKGITTLCLTPIAPPEAVAGWIEAMAPG
ncbi:MAG TPA: LLM class F420-dependent oxidoreductase [Solirubrobacteraceae bacterium]|nr:LLM class F420-dependent oxidoreductase [Solirubrobacteraceae bacterium]